MRRKGFLFIFKAQDDLRNAFLVQFGHFVVQFGAFCGTVWAFCGAVWGILWCIF